MSEEFVDESLYSRQLYVMGIDAQRKMAISNILIVGLNGLGVETAKNVILAGTKSVTLWDPQNCTYSDLSSQFYLNESHIGSNRATACCQNLSELNPYVQVSVLPSFSMESLKCYSVVVVTDLENSLTREIAEFCHNNQIAFILGEAKGVFGRIFCDFGENFTVSDPDGEIAPTSMLAGIVVESSKRLAVLTTLEESRHQLSSGDVVEISDVTGIAGINGARFSVRVLDPFSFEVNVDPSTLSGVYERGGRVTLIKQPVQLTFQSYSQSIISPGEFVVDFMKMDHAPVLHLAFQTLSQFSETHSMLPLPGDESHAQEVMELTRSLNGSLAQHASPSAIDPQSLEDHSRLVLSLARTSRGLTSPVAAFLGGVLGQEVLKACSGKFTPIRQWFYYDCMEVLPDTPLPPEQVQPRGSRYDGAIMVHGTDFQKKLARLRLFVVGAGAIGCELLKNWALMGVGCEEPGCIVVTDMDHIEKSNLSRQFLFRNSDIGRPKSLTASRAALQINPSLRVIAHEHKAGPETESIFDDDFFESLDMVYTALDNVEARLYVDQRCLFYQKPLLESGTLGTKGHTQIVLPGVSEHYGASQDPPEKSIPVCTLKHFPNLIEHTLQWSREWFEESFSQTPIDVNTYLQSESLSNYHSSLATQQNMKMDILNRVHSALVTSRPSSFQDCLAWARVQFEDLFSNKIKQLLHNFPADKTTPEGVKFWSGSKRPPAPLSFDPADPLHKEFVQAAAVMLARVYGLAGSWEDDVYYSVAPSTPVPTFSPQEGVRIPTTEEENKAQQLESSSDVDLQCDRLLRSLPPQSSVSSLSLLPLSFDKDSDDQMRVVAACGNLRARNYRISEVDLHTARGIAGKITPAIATTTALVTGAVCLEMMKILRGKDIEQHANLFANLALPLFASSTPISTKSTTTEVKGRPWTWNPWSRIEVNEPDMTLADMIDWLEEEWGVNLEMLSSGATMLYSEFTPKKKREERKRMTLKAVVESVTKKQIPSNQKYLIFEIIGTNADDGKEMELPYLRFRLK